jgi:hypothetical protein
VSTWYEGGRGRLGGGSARGAAAQDVEDMRVAEVREEGLLEAPPP